MRWAPETSVPREERSRITPAGLTDWDAARVFLEVVCYRSVRSAVDRLNLSINLVRERIDDFERQIGAAPFTGDASSANHRVVANGAGIVTFPTYDCEIGRKILPLKIELRRPFGISLPYHPGRRRIPTGWHMVDRLVEAFNSAKFPWFTDKLVHPCEFKAVYRGESPSHCLVA